jgi:hypothetical protein
MRMDRFLQCEGLEPTSMCLLHGLSQSIRDRLLRQNMIMHLAGLPSHQRRVVPTPRWARGLDNQRTGHVAQKASRTGWTVPWMN